MRIHEVPVDWIDDTDSRVHVASDRDRRPRGHRAHGPAVRDRAAAASISARSNDPAIADDFGRRFVSFALIGAVSTAISLVLFLVLRNAIGPVAANVGRGDRDVRRERVGARARTRARGHAAALGCVPFACVRGLAGA